MQRLLELLGSVVVARFCLTQTVHTMSTTSAVATNLVGIKTSSKRLPRTRLGNVIDSDCIDGIVTVSLPPALASILTTINRQRI